MKSGFSRLAVWLALFCCNCFVFAEFSRADLITAQLEGNSGFSGNNYPGQSVFLLGRSRMITCFLIGFQQFRADRRTRRSAVPLRLAHLFC